MPTKKVDSNRVVMMPNRATVMLLFHLYVFGSEFQQTQTNVDAVGWLKNNGMIQSTGKVKSGQSVQYEVTGKGVAWLDEVMATPLPVATTTFVIPRKE